MEIEFSNILTGKTTKHESCKKCGSYSFEGADCDCEKYEFKYGDEEDYEDYYPVHAESFEDALDKHLQDFDGADGYPTQVITVRCGDMVKDFSCEAEFSIDWYKHEVARSEQTKRGEKWDTF